MTTHHHFTNTIWQQYLKERDHARLLAAASQEQDERRVLQLFLWWAIGLGDWELAKKLEDRQVNLPYELDAWPGLINQALDQFGDVPRTVEWLINHGARIDARGPNNWTGLHLACCRGYLGAIDTLVKCGADVNAQTSYDGGRTPLMEACASGRIEVVEYLLAHGANPEILNTQEGKARGFAARSGHPEIVALLDAWSKAKPPGRP